MNGGAGSDPAKVDCSPTGFVLVPTEPARGTAGTRIGLGIGRAGLFVTALVIALIGLVLVVGAVTLGRRRSTA